MIFIEPILNPCKRRTIMNPFSPNKGNALSFQFDKNMIVQQLNLKIFIYLIVLFILNGASAQSANYEWAFHMGNSSFSTSEQGHSTTIDDNGDIISVGSFHDSIDLDPSSGEYYLYSNGFRDCFIQKIDPNKNLIWAIRIGGPSNDQAFSVTNDSDGNIYILGTYRNTVDFDPGPDYYNMNSSAGIATFILKLDSNGDFVWAKRNHGSSSTCEGKSIALDPNNNILISGNFQGTPDFDTGTGTFALTSNGYIDAFVQKLDNNGDFMWAAQIGGIQDDRSYMVTSDSDGNVYTVGEFHNMVDFDPGSGTYLLSAGGFLDGFVQKLDPSGNLLWVHRIGDPGRGSVRAVTTDKSGNLIIAGIFFETVDFDSGTGVYNLTSVDPWYNTFIQKLSLNGEHIWVKTMDAGRPSDILTDASGKIYTAGTFEVDMDFDPGLGVYDVQTYGTRNMFIQKLDTSGDFLWAKFIAGFSNSDGFIKDIELDMTGNIYATGDFYSTMDFDPNGGTANLTSNGGDDAFVYKLSQGPVTSLHELNEDKLIHAYPNPSIDGSVTIEFDQVLKDATITITQLDGSIIRRDHFASLKSTQIMLGESNGIYLLTVESNSGIKTIILQKM